MFQLKIFENLVLLSVFTTFVFCSNDKICAPFKASSDQCKIILNLQHLRNDCGQVCDTSIKPSSTGKYYDTIQKDFECINLFESPKMFSRNEIANNKAPLSFKEVPNRIKDLYSYNKRVAVRDFYKDDATKETSEPPVWTVQKVAALRYSIRNGFPKSNYGLKAGKDVYTHLKEHMSDVILGGHILVIGSESPWLEAMLLELGAENVTTVDYVAIKSLHPKIKTITPEEMSKQFLTDAKFRFDGIATYSSVEHSGLGRYGDSLNPWGDLIIMAQSWCLTRPGGKMLIGVPTGYDSVYFNIGRIYGPVQYSHLFANWDLIYTEAKMFKDGIRTKEEDLPCEPSFSCYQPIHILQKKAD